MSAAEEWETITNPLAREDQRRYGGDHPVNNFPTVQLPDVTTEERTALAEVHEVHEAKEEHKFRGLMALLTKARHGPLYAGSVPTATKRARRKAGKAQRAARKVHR